MFFVQLILNYYSFFYSLRNFKCLTVFGTIAARVAAMVSYAIRRGDIWPAAIKHVLNRRLPASTTVRLQTGISLPRFFRFPYTGTWFAVCDRRTLS